MASYKATWTGWQKKDRPHGIQGYTTPRDRAFALYIQGTPALGKASEALTAHERSVLWASALKVVTTCEKPYLVKLDAEGDGADYEDIEMSCFEFILLYANERSRVEPKINFGETHSFDYCVVCDVARGIYEGIKE